MAQSLPARDSPEAVFAVLFDAREGLSVPLPATRKSSRGRGAAPPCAPYNSIRWFGTSPVHLADLAHGFLDPFGVGVPECLEFWLVQIGKILPEIGQRSRELRAV